MTKEKCVPKSLMSKSVRSVGCLDWINSEPVICGHTLKKVNCQIELVPELIQENLYKLGDTNLYLILTGFTDPKCNTPRQILFRTWNFKKAENAKYTFDASFSCTPKALQETCFFQIMYPMFSAKDFTIKDITMYPIADLYKDLENSFIELAESIDFSNENNCYASSKLEFERAVKISRHLLEAGIHSYLTTKRCQNYNALEELKSKPINHIQDCDIYVHTEENINITACLMGNRFGGGVDINVGYIPWRNLNRIQRQFSYDEGAHYDPNSLWLALLNQDATIEAKDDNNVERYYIGATIPSMEIFKGSKGWRVCVPKSKSINREAAPGLRTIFNDLEPDIIKDDWEICYTNKYTPMKCIDAGYFMKGIEYKNKVVNFKAESSDFTLHPEKINSINYITNIIDENTKMNACITINVGYVDSSNCIPDISKYNKITCCVEGLPKRCDFYFDCHENKLSIEIWNTFFKHVVDSLMMVGMGKRSQDIEEKILRFTLNYLFDREKPAITKE